MYQAQTCFHGAFGVTALRQLLRPQFTLGCTLWDRNPTQSKDLDWIKAVRWPASGWDEATSAGSFVFLSVHYFSRCYFLERGSRMNIYFCYINIYLQIWAIQTCSHSTHVDMPVRYALDRIFLKDRVQIQPPRIARGKRIQKILIEENAIKHSVS